MLRGLYTSATGMRAQELLIDNTANNLANVNTNGFKRSQLDFADLIYITPQQPGNATGNGQASPTGLQIGSGVRPEGTTKIFTPGAPFETRNPFDVAINGDGFIKVQTPAGERYTRDGALRPNDQGVLVTVDGYQLVNGPTITADIDPQTIKISTEGRVTGSATNQGNSQDLGAIQLFRFQNPAGLKAEGGNLFSLTDAAGAEIAVQESDVSLRQGFLERSNVEAVRELISLITAQRAYEINSRAIRAGDEMLSTTVEIVR